MVAQEKGNRIRDRLQDPFGSRIWLWSSFILVAAILAVAERLDPGGDFGALCRNWLGCFAVLPVGAAFVSVVAWAVSLLFLGWSKRTRPWVYACGFVVTLFFLMTLVYIGSRE